MAKRTVLLRVAVQGTSKDDAIHVCYKALAKKLAAVLGIASEDMDSTTQVASLGLDSLVTIEIRN